MNLKLSDMLHENDQKLCGGLEKNVKVMIRGLVKYGDSVRIRVRV